MHRQRGWLTRSSPPPSPPAGRPIDEQITEVGTLLLRRGLLIRCDRRFNRPPPGQARLIKFPKKVVPVQGPDAGRFSEDGFYAWTYDKPTSPLVYVFSLLAAVGVIMVCLFPVAPYWFKAGVVYFLASLLSVIIFTLAIRAIIAAVSYVGTGRTVWLLPNALADDKPLSQLFKPLIAVEEANVQDGRWAMAKQLLTRLAVGLLLGGVTYVLYAKSPGSDAVRKNAFKYRDELFDMLHVHEPQLLTKGQGTSPPPPPVEPEPAAAPEAPASSADANAHDEL